MSEPSKQERLSAAALHAEVRERFGVLPNFFRLAPDSPEIMANMWGFAKFAYLDSPLPALFKERLFVYLSRFCEVRYCIARHVGFLVGLGRPSGDRQCPSETTNQVIELLRRPLPWGDDLQALISLLETSGRPLPHPFESVAGQEKAIFACAAHVFLQTAQAPRCLESLQGAFDAVTFQQFTVFLAFVRTAHFWTRMYSELTFEDDIKELLTVHETLAECILNDPEAESCETTQVLLQELAEMRKRREQIELDVSGRQQNEQPLHAIETSVDNDLEAISDLHELGVRLLGAPSLPAAAEEMLVAVIARVGANSGTVQVYDPGEKVLRFVAQHGFDPAALAALPVIGPDYHSSCAQALREGRRVVVEDFAESTESWAVAHRTTAAELGYRAAISTPLVSQGRVILGMLTLHFHDAKVPSKRELLLIDLYGRQTVHLIERERSLERERQLARKTADANAKFRAVFEQSSVFAGIMSPDGMVIDANRLCLDMCGYRAVEVLGRPFWEIPWWRESPEIQAKIKTGSAQAAQGIPYHEELPYVWADGTQRVGDFALFPICDDLGRVIFLHPTGSDITDRRRLERENAQQVQATRILAAIVESSEDAIISKSLNGIIQSWNVAAERLFGYTPEQALGQHISLLIPAERISEEDQIIARLRAGERVEHFDTVRMRRDGTHIPVSLTISPVRDETGRVIGASKIVRDITERVLSEEKLQRDAIALAEADRRKNEFLAMLAHELRNPLAPIRNSLQILRMSAANDSTSNRMCEMMERQVNHMVRLVEDLMEVSRITRGAIELRKEETDLVSLMRSAVETSKPLMEANEHQLAISLPVDPVPLYGDSVRLAQVFSNLLNNAAKYTDRGGQIWLNARREGTDIVVSIRDTGIGIPSDMLPVIFDMFMQVDRSTARSQGGLGIGLTLVKTLVELHGGTVVAHSDGPGLGSEFMVRLPVAVTKVSPGRIPSANPTATELTVQRVLIVDDNQDSAASLGMVLKLLGTDVRVVNAGTAALAAIESYRPNVILLDIGMPGMDGYEVARRIRENPNNNAVVLIALTGWGQSEDRRRTQEAGFNYHLVKPADIRELRSVLGSIAK